MAEVTNGVLKFHDEQTGQWVEVQANPIAQEVVRIMKENNLKNKGNIKLMSLKYGENEQYTHYIAYQDNTSQSVLFNAEGTLPYILNDLYSKKGTGEPLSNNEVLNNFDATSFLDGVKTFDVIYKDTAGVDVQVKSNALPQDYMRTFYIDQNSDKNFTISYVFNDNPVSEKQYEYKANQ